ncbi:hypothetical protein T484DRAFT_1798110 [Baffinella frigidus]|nr:hypothetical protein T484DRAFT_1798110 [Cryptophyta sp. CCMP2293]
MSFCARASSPLPLSPRNMSFPARASSPLPAAPPPRLMSLQGKPMPVATQPGGGSGAAGEIAVVALHSYTSSGPKPFPDDPRPELGLVRGDRLFVISISPDGWCLARRPHSALEGWLPGNFLSADGETPIEECMRHSGVP